MPRARIWISPTLALLATLCGVSCLTTGVIDKAYDRYGHYAAIMRISDAGLRDENLFLQLDVQQEKQAALQTIVLRVPVDEVGTYRRSTSGGTLEKDGLKLATPPLGCFETAGQLPDGVVPVVVEYLDVQDHLELDDRIYALSTGVHVLIVRTLYNSKKAPITITRDGTVPPGAQVILVHKSPEHAPRRDSLGAFAQVPKTHKAWLILTPFSVVGDIVTFPFQLLGALIVGC